MPTPCSVSSSLSTVTLSTMIFLTVTLSTLTLSTVTLSTVTLSTVTERCPVAGQDIDSEAEKREKREGDEDDKVLFSSKNRVRVLFTLPSLE